MKHYLLEMKLLYASENELYILWTVVVTDKLNTCLFNDSVDKERSDYDFWFLVFTCYY